MLKQKIKNRKKQNIAVLVEKSEPQKGVAFIMHGLGGFKEQRHLQAIAEAFLENNYTVVRFDTTNTSGESDGNYEDATATNYYEDLEDVINWATAQSWYEEPFVLVGHSLGGLCVSLFAEKFPNKIKALAPISTAVSGSLTKEAYQKYRPQEFSKWCEIVKEQKEIYFTFGYFKGLKLSFVDDILDYDLIPQADKLVMPKLLIVGEKDITTPLEHQQIFFQALTAKKELHVIKNSPHTFRESGQIAEVKQIFNHWIKGL